MLRSVSLAVLLALSIVSTAAQACNGSGSIFADDFSDDSGGWQSDPGMAFGKPALVVTIQKGSSAFSELNSTFDISGDFAVCADVNVSDRKDLNPANGLLFWAKDYTTFYGAWLNANGELQVWRKNQNVWSKLFTGPVSGIKTGTGTTNDLGVTVKGGLVSISLNGAEIRRFRAQPPDGITHFGFFMETDKPVDGDALTQPIANYKVSKVS